MAVHPFWTRLPLRHIVAAVDNVQPGALSFQRAMDMLAASFHARLPALRCRMRAAPSLPIHHHGETFVAQADAQTLAHPLDDFLRTELDGPGEHRLAGLAHAPEDTVVGDPRGGRPGPCRPRRAACQTSEVER